MSYVADVKPGKAVHLEFRGSFRILCAFEEQCKMFIIIFQNQGIRFFKIQKPIQEIVSSMNFMICSEIS